MSKKLYDFMDKEVFRLQKVSIRNLKNVKNGAVTFPTFNDRKFTYSSDKSEIVGLYGQNGSGKTTLVLALEILKDLLIGNSLNNSLFEDITVTEKSCDLEFVLSYEEEGKQHCLIYYDVTITKREDREVFISNEKIAIRNLLGNAFKVDLFEAKVKGDDVNIHPIEALRKKLQKDKKKSADLYILHRKSLKESRSYLFASDLLDLLESYENNPATGLLGYISIWMVKFALRDLTIINNKSHSQIETDDKLNFFYRVRDSYGLISLNIAKATYLSEKNNETITKIINQMNKVINTIIPNLKLELKEVDKITSLDTDKVKIAVDLLSNRDGNLIPFRNESAGIKKIISILSALISVYNNKSYCLVIDELDSGVFEYLLGELLTVIDRYGKGQLVFTSHNLRPLEVLKSKSIWFTTNNNDDDNKNRYVRIPNVRGTNNLRSIYFNKIILGDEKVDLYDSTSTYNISHAFRNASNLGTIEVNEKYVEELSDLFDMDYSVKKNG